MPSPFPGMDPYLEDPAYWPDLHHSFATYIRDDLQPLLHPHYYAHPRCWDYLVTVSPAGWRYQFEVYRRTVREPLPRVSVPLAQPDPDVVLDLQSILTRCYENGAYGETINYTVGPPNPLPESDQEWARERLAVGRMDGDA